jgi:hypothetical protein
MPLGEKTMKILTFLTALAAGAAFGAAALAADTTASRDPATVEITALARQWETAGNGGAGDPVAALSGMVVQGPQVMQDNFPPFIWIGPNALKEWLGDYVANVGKEHDTDMKTEVGPARYVRAEGDRVYAAFPVTYTYKKAGVAVIETLAWSVVARRTAQGLKFESMAYAGGPDN